jgi:hypothetical protein
VTTYRVRLEAPTALALQMVTALANADGVDLVSSGHPSRHGDGVVELLVEVDATRPAVDKAMRDIRAGLPDGASVSLDGL